MGRCSRAPPVAGEEHGPARVPSPLQGPDEPLNSAEVEAGEQAAEVLHVAAAVLSRAPRLGDHPIEVSHLSALFRPPPRGLIS